MKFKNLKLKKLLTNASKAAAFIVLLTVVFSPLQQILSTPVAFAAPITTKTDCAAKGYQWSEIGSGTCTIPSSTQSSCSAAGGVWQGNVFGSDGTCYAGANVPVAGSNDQSSCTAAGGTWQTAALGGGSCVKGAAAPPGAGGGDDIGCNFSSSTGWSICLSNIVYVFTVGLGSGMAYIGAFIFDNTVALSLNSSAYALNFLSSGWATARDLANMAFILILVYIAFMIMFEAETTRTIQMLAWVIFIALIINFSFFLTRVVIDVGNILAVQFYNSIPNSPTLDKTFSQASSGSLAGASAQTSSLVINYFSQTTLANTKDLTASIMGALNIQQLFDQNSFKSFLSNSSFLSKLIILSTLYISIGAAYFIMAAMFLTVGIKFLMRIVVLWFLIIAAPLAFVARAVPKTSINAWYGLWQDQLFKHAFYPAIFLFIFFFIASVMGSLGSQTGILGGLATDLSRLSANPDIGGVIYLASAIANVGIRLGFVVAMLYIALKASEFVGVQGAGMANKATSFAFGSAGRLAAAPFRVAGRGLLGAPAAALVNNKVFSSRALTAPTGFGRGIWRDLERGANAVGKASYDPRNAPGASVLKKGVEKITNAPVNVGKPAEGGIMAQMKERTERIKKEQAARATLLRDEENKRLIQELASKSTEHDTLETKEKTPAGLTTSEKTHKNELKVEIEKMATKVNSLSKREVETFKLAEIEKVLKHTKEGIIKKVEESDKHSDREKEGIREEWANKMGEVALGKSQNIIQELKQIHTDLTTRGTIPPASITVLNRLTTPGALVDSAGLKELGKELRDEMAAAKVRANTAATPAEKIKHEKSLQNLQEARDQITALNKEREGIPTSAGGAPNSKEFLVA